MDEAEDLDDADLAAAIALSMTENLEEEAASTPATATTTSTATTTTTAVTTAATSTTTSTVVVDEQQQIKNALKDKEFLADLLGSAGVDSDDLALADIISGLGADDEEEEANKKQKLDKKPEEEGK